MANEDTTLRIIFEDGGPPGGTGGPSAGRGTPPPSVPGTALAIPGQPGGGGSSYMYAANITQMYVANVGQLMIDGASRGGQGMPSGARVTNYQPGVKAPLVQGATGGAEEEGGWGGAAKFAAAVAGATVVMKTFTTAVSMAAEWELTKISIQQQTAGGDLYGGQAADFRLKGRMWSHLPIVGQLMQTAFEYRARQVEQFQSGNKIVDDRAERLGEFSPQLAARLAQRRVAQTTRDIGEAGAIGPEFSAFTQRQTELDRYKQAVEAVARQKLISEQTKETNEQIRKLRKETGKLMEEGNEETRKLIRAILDGGKSPLSQLLGGLKIPDDASGVRENADAVNKLRDLERNKPVFAGG